MHDNLTLSMIKPDAVRNNHIGAIITKIEEASFAIKAMVMLQFTQSMAKRFYAVHAHRPFYEGLCTFIASGPIVAMVLQKDHAVVDLRRLMGATDPAEASEGTIRKLFGTSIDYNAIHGSDSVDSASLEIAFFFPTYTLV